MADKETAIKCFTKYFEDSIDIFLYGSKVYSGNSNDSDTDAVIIKEGNDFILFRGEVPKLGEAHIVITGEDELHKINKRKDIPIMARPPLSSLTCPRELIYERKDMKDFHKEIYEMIAENVLEYVIPRLKIAFPYEEDACVKPSKIIKILRNEIAPLADPKLECGKRPEYLDKWKKWDAWKLTEGIISDCDVEAYLRKNNMLAERCNGNSFKIKIPQIVPSIEEDKKRIFEWREKKLVPAITTNFSELI